MKLIFTLVLALMLTPLNTYAGPDYHNHHKQPLGGSSNSLFTPVGKLKQQELSKRSPLSSFAGESALVRRMSWLKINSAAIDALRTYSIDVFGSATDDNPDFALNNRKNYEGEVFSVRVKNAHDFPLDINFNFFEDIQFTDLYLNKITKTITKEGEIYYSLVIVQHNTSLPAVNIILRDMLTIHTSIEQFNITVEQVNKAPARIILQEIPVLIEGHVNSVIKKPESLNILDKAPLSEEFNPFVTPQKVIHQEPTATNSTTRNIDVLVLFDKYSDQSFAKSYTVLRGIAKINKILTASNVNAEFGIVAYDNLPTSICGGASVCYSAYEKNLAEITASKEVLNLRLKYAADVVVVVRNTKDGNLKYQTSGIANLTNPSDPYQANKTIALMHYQSGEQTFAHELGHILGAGHSAYNSAPGKGPAIAYLGFYDDKEVSPYHKDAVKTLMTYDYICKQQLDAVNISNPGKSQQRCVSVDQFSGPVQYAAPWSNQVVTIGSAGVANRFRVSDVSFRAPGWSQEIINHKPVPAIKFISVSGITGQPHCFNGVGTTDPDGDRIVRFYWFVMKFGKYVKVKEAEYGSKESTFCWTPSSSQTGDYRVYLSVRDDNGAEKITGKGIYLKYEPDYISAPTLYLNTHNNYYITLSWAKPKTGNVSYYQVEKKMDGGSFSRVANSNDTVETFIRSGLSSNQNYFRVRGCTSSNICGVWSNTLNYKP
jgi:hypothetical protein